MPVEDDGQKRALKQLLAATRPPAEKPKVVASMATRPRRHRSTDWAPTAPYPGSKKGRKTSLDEVWPEVCADLNPTTTPRQVLVLLDQRYPGRFRPTQISTIGDKLKVWRYEHSLPVEFERLKPGKKSNVDEVWQLALTELKVQPNLSVNELLRLLITRFPERVNHGHRTSLYERLRCWRRENIEKLEAADPSRTATLKVTIFEEALNVVSQIASN